MPKIAIVCDDYKEQMFIDELKAKGIIFEVKPFTVKGYVMFRCISEQHIIGPITEKVTKWWADHFKKQRKYN